MHKTKINQIHIRLQKIVFLFHRFMGLTQLESTIHLALKSFTHFFLTPKICFYNITEKWKSCPKFILRPI